MGKLLLTVPAMIAEFDATLISISRSTNYQAVERGQCKKPAQPLRAFFLSPPKDYVLSSVARHCESFA